MTVALSKLDPCFILASRSLKPAPVRSRVQGSHKDDTRFSATTALQVSRLQGFVKLPQVLRIITGVDAICITVILFFIYARTHRDNIFYLSYVVKTSFLSIK